MPYLSPNLTYNITLDIECERATPIIRIGKDTEGARIQAELVSGNSEAVIDTSKTFGAILWWQKPDGTLKTTEGKFVTQNGKVCVLFGVNADFTDISGRCYATVDLRSNDEGDPDLVPELTSILKTQVFYVDVEGFPEKKNYNGINIVSISKKQYDELPTKDTNTLYLVRDGDIIYLYLGNIQVGGSSGYNEVQGDVYIDNVSES